MEKRNAALLRSYGRYLKLERNFTHNTLDAYLRDVEKLLEYAEAEGLEVKEITTQHLQHFAATLHEVGIAARSQARILSGVRSFFRFLRMDGRIESDPTELLESPLVGQHLPEVLSTEEVDQLEAAIDLTKWEGHRNRAIVEVLFSCGLRVSELTGLKLSNLYIEEEFLRVEGKGRKERLVPLSPKAIKELHLWFDDRRHMDIKPGEEDYVFLNRRGSHLTRTMILIIIKRLAEEAGIKKTISPHTLRHSCTTEIYTHIDTHTLREEILNHHPRNLISHPPKDGDDPAGALTTEYTI